MSRNNFLIRLFCCFAMSFLFSGMVETRAQTTGSQYMSENNSNGFTLKKVVSDTTIATGQTFSYYLYFSIPAGATTVLIKDVLPSGLVYQGYTMSAVCGASTVTIPTVGVGGTVTNSTNGIFQVAFPSVAVSCSGTICITVNFPNGTTCNGAAVRNNACTTGNLGPIKVDFCTGFVTTTAIATNPWQVSKYILNAAYQGGSCPYATIDSVIEYQVCVSKIYGTTGQLNLVNGVMTDVLPVGATLVSSTCGVTQTASTLTWNVGNLVATLPYNQVCCTFKVLYPRALFPLGSSITNTPALSGGLGAAAANGPSCGTFSNILGNTTCVQIKPVTLTTSGYLSKYAYTNGQAGCGGYYQIYFCNTGTAPISGLTITDVLPTTLTGYTLSNGAGVTSSITSGTMTATYAGSLAPGACAFVNVTFTIPSSAAANSTITNCASATYTGLATPVQSCWSFVVQAPAANACIWKDVCNLQPSYLPGQIIRYRLRVQNIGGQPITGASITDILNPNLQYVGNPAYYTTTNWASPCSSPALPSGATALTGVTASQSGQTLTFNLPSIPASCQSLFYVYCSNYGNTSVPYNYIEFDVKIKDTACLGNIPNFFAISGGNVVAQNSNVIPINVTGTAAFNTDKTVSIDNGTTYAASALSSAGSNVQFKLKFTPSVLSTSAMRHVTFLDLMPRDKGTLDGFITARPTSRGSQYDLIFQNSVSTSPAANGGYDLSNVTDAFINTLIVPSVGAMFPYAVGTNTPNWTSVTTNTVIPVGSKNIFGYFGAAPIATSSAAEAIFKAQIPAGTAAGLTACNSYVANAAVCHLINSGLMTNTSMGYCESGKVCVDVTQSPVTVCCDSVKIIVLPNNPCCSRITSSKNCEIKNISVTLSNGTISGATFAGTSATCFGSTTAANGLATYTFSPSSGVCGGGMDLQLCVNATVAGSVGIVYVITFANGETCTKDTKVNCDVLPVNCCDAIRIIKNPVQGKCCSQMITGANCKIKGIDVTVTNGTLGNVTFAGTTASAFTGLSSSTLTANTFVNNTGAGGSVDITVCPTPSANPTYIKYIINFTDGTSCTKLDTLNCLTDCCRATQVTQITTNGQCCSRLVSACPVKELTIDVSNGNLGNVTFAGTGFTGLTNSTLTMASFGNTNPAVGGIDVTICPRPTANPVIVHYVMFLADGTKCEKYDTLRCTPPVLDSCTIAACYAVTATGLSVNFNATGTTSNNPIVMYVWDFGDATYGTSTTPTISHNYAANGSYVVCMTVHTLFKGSICTCTKTICKTIKIAQGSTFSTGCTRSLIGGGTTNEIGKMVASPNPSSGNFHITLVNSTEFLSQRNAEIKVLNLQGQVVFSKAININEAEFDINGQDFPAGLYFISLLKDSELISTIKIVKN